MSVTARASEYTVKRTLADGTVKSYRYNRAKEPTRPVDTMSALISAYRSSPEWAGLKQISRKNYQVYIGVWEASRILLACPVADIRRRQVLALRDAVAAQRGPAAANVFMRTTSVLLKWAVEREWIELNPIAGTKRLPGGHLRAWTDAEYHRAVKALPEHLRRAVVLARLTGQRRGDLMAMRWSAYDGAHVLVQQQKGRNGASRPPLRIPASTVLRRELDAWRGDAPPTAPILTTVSGGAWRRTYLSTELGEALTKIGPDLAGLNVHGLRKLAAASLAEAGCSTHEIAAITGHRTLAMVELYTASARQRQLADAAGRRMDGPAKRPAKDLRNAS